MASTISGELTFYNGNHDYKSVPEKTLINQEITECITAAMDDLPEAMKETACLYLIEKQPLDTIAKYLNYPPGTVRSRTFRIKNT